MILEIATVVALSRQCAPSVAVETLVSLVHTESRFNPYVIGVNAKGVKAPHPVDRLSATAAARSLIARGYNIDLGLGQINSANLRWLGLSVEDAFDRLAIWTHIVRRPITDYPEGEFRSAFAADLDAKYRARVTAKRMFVKGVGVVIPNLLSWADSVVVLDVKRENWDITAGFRARHGQAVYLFDPLDPEGRTARYNPLSFIDRLDDVDVVNELQKIGGMLFPAPEKADPFWAEAARAAFVGVGALVAANPALPFTIGEIYRRLTAGDPKVELPKVVEEAQKRGQRLSQACVSALSDFTSASDNTFSGIKQTITSKLSLWLNRSISESDQRRALMMPQELMQMPKGELLLLRGGMRKRRWPSSWR